MCGVMAFFARSLTYIYHWLAIKETLYGSPSGYWFTRGATINAWVSVALDWRTSGNSLWSIGSNAWSQPCSNNCCDGVDTKTLAATGLIHIEDGYWYVTFAVICIADLGPTSPRRPESLGLVSRAHDDLKWKKSSPFLEVITWLVLTKQ